MSKLTVTTEGLINRVFTKNVADVWHGWSAIDTDYHYLSVDGYWVKGQAYKDRCNTRDEGVIEEDVLLDKERVLKSLSGLPVGSVLQWHRSNGYRSPEPENIAIRTKDGWQLQVDVDLYFK